MKKRNFLFPVLASLGLLMGACSNNESDNGQVVNDLEVKFRSDITARVSAKTTGNSWDANDQVGIFMKTAGLPLAAANILESADNVAYQTPDGNSALSAVSNKVVYPNSASENVDFIAYYPYSNTAIDSDYKYALNVADQTNQAAIDFLYSNNARTKNNTVPNVQLTFKHQLSKLAFNISATNNLTDADLAGITIKISGANTTAKLNLADGTISDEAAVADINANVAANGKSGEAIVLPVADASVITLTFTLSNGVECSHQLVASSKFESNKKYTYNVEIAGASDLSVTASIEDWEDGGTTNITNAHKYAVGDVYPYSGAVEGVVYEISEGGRHGKVVSLYKHYGKWSLNAAVSDGCTDVANGANNMTTIQGLTDWQTECPIFNTISLLGSDWYIPAIDELKALYAQSASINTTLVNEGGVAISGAYCSSTEDYIGAVAGDEEPWNGLAFNGTNVYRQYKTTPIDYLAIKKF